MTHASVAGISLEVDDALIRLSVGIEAADDLDRGPAPGASTAAVTAYSTGSRSIVRTWRVPPPSVRTWAVGIAARRTSR